MKHLAMGALIAGSLLFVAVTLSNNSEYPGVVPAKLGGEPFVVSSERDAGPASLRDAILAADRLSERAHIVITARRIMIESALPALVNPHGVFIEAGPGAGIVDAAHLVKGAALQINSPTSMIRGLKVVNAHEIALVISAPGAALDHVAVSNSKVGILLGSAAKGCLIGKSVFEGNETAITAETGVQDVAITDSVFRSSSRAGFWFVGAAAAAAPPTGTALRANAEPPVNVRMVGNTFEGNATGVVIANRPTLIQKSRFIDSRESAVLILGGAARVEDNEIRSSGGTAISVTAGISVRIARNILIGNPGTAIAVRDSDASIEGNRMQDNGFGIVSVSSQTSNTLIRDNWISKSAADAITVIGGSPLLQRNQVLGNGGAGIRVLDLLSSKGDLKAAPRLEDNVLKDNRVDLPAPGVYRLASVPP